MINRDLYFRDPTTLELLNNGVSKVFEIGHDEGQIKTLRFELQTFVCDGEYARGLERMLKAYLDGLGKAEQKAVWVSGFFGSGKSHLVKVLRYLWEDYRFPDGATARSLVTLPAEITDLLTELSNRSKPLGGLRAAAGTLGAGAMDNVRLAFIQLVLRAAGLPENLAQARFMLWLRSSGLEAKVAAALQLQNRQLAREVLSLKLSMPLAEALVSAEPKYATAANAQAAIRDQFKDNNSPTMDDALDVVRQIFGQKGQLPCTLLVVDEVQQFIGEKIHRANDVQEIAEHCSTDLGSRLLFVGTGQSALNTMPSLQRLQARFGVKVQLSDTDVESVIRKTVLRKKPEQTAAISACLDANQGELARHLQNTRLAATHNDDPFFVADYPLLPTRRRFWERVLRNTDHSGTKAQLRSQLQIVFEATQQTAAANLGTVVPADFIYDQIATDLLNSGELEREYDEIIRKQRDGTPDGQLRSSLCALIFLIGKLPRTPGADDGVRANAETLVDLLVGDLRTDRPRLEQQVPAQLQQLVAAGQLMAVEAEYRLQTREGALWTHDLNRRRTAALNDDQRINAKRAELLRDGTKQALKPVSLQQGTSRQPRKLACELSSSRPTTSSDEVTLWLRDGWSDDEKSVLNDARAAGVDSPLLFGYLPRLHHEELKQAIASHLAAQETLEAHGPAGTPEAIEARKAVETHLAIAQHRLQELLGHIIGGAKVFLGGGQEANGIELADKVQDSADSALVRLFPRFAEADHANWGQVVSRARGGDVGALAQVGYPGNPTQHPVCRRVLDLIGAGKKGKDIREHFKAAPFGWPQDAIDGALFVMLVAGNLRATNNGQPVQATLPQNQVGVAHFYVDVQPPDVGQRLNLKALFQKLGITTQNGKESEAAAEFLNKLLALAATAGGPAPRPETPATQDLRDLQMLSGNAQLLRLHELKDDLAAKLAAWKKSAEAISHRWPAWERLLDFHQFAAGLPAADACAQSLAAITAGRGLLADPDPVPELTKQLTTALRTALGKLQDDLAAAFLTGDAKLAASPVWNGRTAEQRATLASRCQLSPPPKAPIGTNDDILAALRARTLTDRRNLLDAVPQRFARALEEAAKLATPQAVRVALPSAIINDQAELDDWLDEVRQQVEDKLKDGPVIL
ncbi:MAG: BREX system P-loop protein BrxC [Chromatiaceae bacterium]|nr:BREX system P-loop protein BrxC [Chromatiaceae bacterium]MBP6733149.1 BREX system P-loop protein BrxC [Chromatiaceae bacterium]MBP8288356.1 BREX system P-loop protein BrxC [Chromatiaceae bacterium]MBP9602524.1 BREX system P-loop protein BrxC [Chromatiaceae bacterium]